MIIAAGEIAWANVLTNTYIQRVVKFSFYQAALSTALSIAFALPVAISLSHERTFLGRRALISLFGLSLVIPTIVAIYGIVVVFGRTGWVNSILAGINAPSISIYGLSGILIAHVFFNMPLATRVFLQALERIPEEQWRQAHQLGMSTVSRFRFIEWPNLKRQLAGLGVLIFSLCFTSFAIVMTLGGGPKATTIEVAIFQAIRFDFDISKAVALACIQLVAGMFVIGLSILAKANHALDMNTRGRLFSKKSSSTHTEVFLYSQPELPNAMHTLIRFGILTIAAAFVLSPLLALALSAFNEQLLPTLTDPITVKATWNTLLVSLMTGSISLLLCLALLFSTRHLRIRKEKERVGNLLQQSGNAILVLPPLVIGTGLFLLLRPFADVFALGLVLVIVINSLMALPFLLRILDAPVMQLAQTHDRLIQSLGLQGWHRLKLIDWPLLRKPMGLSLAIAATLAAGDLSAIALFGSERVRTLAYLLYQRMGSYQLDAAAVTAGLLLILCLILFTGLQRVVGGPNA